MNVFNPIYAQEFTVAVSALGPSLFALCLFPLARDCIVRAVWKLLRQ